MTDEKTWKARSANIFACVSLKLSFALMCVLLYTCTRTLGKAFDIQRFKSNKNAPLARITVLCKAMLCVLDAEI